VRRVISKRYQLLDRQLRHHVINNANARLSCTVTGSPWESVSFLDEVSVNAKCRYVSQTRKIKNSYKTSAFMKLRNCSGLYRQTKTTKERRSTKSEDHQSILQPKSSINTTYNLDKFRLSLVIVTDSLRNTVFFTHIFQVIGTNDKAAKHVSVGLNDFRT
jgi:hypothetical protein